MLYLVLCDRKFVSCSNIFILFIQITITGFRKQSGAGTKKLKLLVTDNFPLLSGGPHPPAPMSTSPSLSMHSDFGGDPSGEGDNNSRGAPNKRGAKTAGRPSSTTPSSSSQVRWGFTFSRVRPVEPIKPTMLLQRHPKLAISFRQFKAQNTLHLFSEWPWWQA